MPQSLDSMLARWPLLYPEIAGASEEDDQTGEAARVRREVIAPLLEAADINGVFQEASEEYRKWRTSLPTEEENLEAVLSLEEEKDDALTAAIGVHSEELGEQEVKAALQSITLLRIVRRTTLPCGETWLEESWERIGHLMTISELCLARILEHLATEEGTKDNVETLARWAFENAFEAYWNEGRCDQNFTRLEDIPE